MEPVVGNMYANLLPSLEDFLKRSTQIGDCVHEMAVMVSEAFDSYIAQLRMSPTTETDHCCNDKEIPRGFSDELLRIRDFKDENTNSPFFCHLHAMCHSVNVLTWLYVPDPLDYVNDITAESVACCDRVLEAYGEDDLHVDWVRAWKQTLADVKSYVEYVEGVLPKPEEDEHNCFDDSEHFLRSAIPRFLSPEPTHSAQLSLRQREGRNNVHFSDQRDYQQDNEQFLRLAIPRVWSPQPTHSAQSSARQRKGRNSAYFSEEMDSQQSPAEALYDASYPEQNTSLEAFDSRVMSSFQEYYSESLQMGGFIFEQAKLVRRVFEEHKNILTAASEYKQPNETVIMSLLYPLNAALQEVKKFTDRHPDLGVGNHLRAVAESVAALGWVFHTPGHCMEDTLFAAMNYFNGVLAVYGDDPLHVVWVRVWREMFNELVRYVNREHSRGLVWNTQDCQACAESLPPSITILDRSMEPLLNECFEKSTAIGGLVLRITNLVLKAMAIHRELIIEATKRPHPTSSSLENFLTPLTRILEEVQQMSDENVQSPFSNHLHALSQSVQSLAWFSYQPGTFIRDMRQVGRFYSNKMMHHLVEACPLTRCVQAWEKTLTELERFVEQEHCTGLMWNPEGSEAPR